LIKISSLRKASLTPPKSKFRRCLIAAAADTIAFHRRYRRPHRYYYCFTSPLLLLPQQQVPQSRPRRSRPEATKPAYKAQAVATTAPHSRSSIKFPSPTA
jgi:hypothetical protein